MNRNKTEDREKEKTALYFNVMALIEFIFGKNCDMLS